MDTQTTATPGRTAGRASGSVGTWVARWLAGVRAVIDDAGPSPRAQWSAMGVVLALCFGVRLMTIGNPPLDRTLWKEIDYLMISANYRSGAPFWLPTVSWPAEGPRFTGMEFPLVPYLTAGLEELFGAEAWVVRSITLVAFLVVATYVFLLVRRTHGPWVAMAAGAAAAALPLVHPFGRLLFSEPSMLAFAVVALYHLGEWLQRRRVVHAIVGTAALSLAIALKIEVLFWLPFPLLVMVWQSGRHRWREWLAPLGLAALALILPVVWYAWAAHLEVTGVHEFSVFRGHDKFQTLALLSTVKWWTTMAGRMFWELLAGPLGFLLALGGGFLLVRRAGGRNAVWVAYGAGVLLYVLVVTEGQRDAPYRQLVAGPVLAFLVGLGAVGLAVAGGMLLSDLRAVRRVPTWAVGVAAALLAAATPLLQIDSVVLASGPDADRVEFAAQIQRFARPADEMAVLGEYDIKKGGNDISPVLFYYTGLRGWLLEPQDCSAAAVENLARRGATLFAVVPPTGLTAQPDCGSDPDDLNVLKSRHPVLVDDGRLLLIDLTNTRRTAS